MSKKRKRRRKKTVPKKKQASAAKHWFLTINNPTVGDIAGFHDDDEELTDHLSFVMIGRHVGEKSKIPHIHAVIACKNRMRKTALIKKHPRADIQIRRGTLGECEAYLAKEKNVYEIGVRPLATLACRWEESYKCAKEGRIGDIPKDMLVKYYHTFKRIQQDNPIIPADLKVKKNYWIIAPSGYGKSTYARERWPNYYDKSPNKWWVGYKGQQTILLDDFGPKQCEHLDWLMKRWADNFSFPAESKGGGRQIRPQNIVLTTQYSIEECWTDEKVVEAIENRFKVIKLLHWKKRLSFK